MPHSSDELDIPLTRASPDIPRDENHPDFVGECEACPTLLFEGDRGLHCDDGPYLCEKHCPTWAHAKREWEDQVDTDLSDDDLERREAFMKSYDAHVAAGGSPGDKLSFPL